MIASWPWAQTFMSVRQLVTAYDPDDDPLTLPFVRDDHLRVTNGTAEDSYIQTLIATSLSIAQNKTQRRILPETWRVISNGFPVDVFELPFPPVIEVLSVTYQDNGTQTLDAANYVVSMPYGTEAGRAVISPVYGYTWPTLTPQAGAVTVEFRTGYVVSGVSPEEVDVPEAITQARLLIITDLYERRGNQTTGTIVTPNMITAFDILESFRDRTVAG